jgi:hypothetical protein
MNKSSLIGPWLSMDQPVQQDPMQKAIWKEVGFYEHELVKRFQVLSANHLAFHQGLTLGCRAVPDIFIRDPESPSGSQLGDLASGATEVYQRLNPLLGMSHQLSADMLECILAARMLAIRARNLKRIS